ncbi:unnamed protein product [Brachionus calyciflorus]|uniref:BEN domain-containing protein n=1 Tax=Brachionus calyciflorus TaxID=104777 RepID=A0A814QUR0_9BILA|nr:unnamed protein product [Brachionus calyciflorus]
MDSQGYAKIRESLIDEKKYEQNSNSKNLTVESSNDESDNDKQEPLPLQYSEIPSIYLKSISISHFATLLAERIFKPTELKGEVNVYCRSIYGEKKSLNQEKIDIIMSFVIDKLDGKENKKKSNGNRV